jgi:hypothetical protein
VANAEIPVIIHRRHLSVFQGNSAREKKSGCQEMLRKARPQGWRFEANWLKEML